MVADDEYFGDDIDELNIFMYYGLHVPIDNPNMCLYDVDSWIKNERNSNNGVISPEFAMEVLSKTNHCAHLKKVVRNIKERCNTKEEVWPYRGFILACVAGREMSNAVLSDLRELAKLGHCKNFFEECNDEPKIYNTTDCMMFNVNNNGEYATVKDKNVTIQTSNAGARFLMRDFSCFNRCIFSAGTLELVKCKGFSGVLNFSYTHVLNLSDSDLSNVDEIKFKKGADVNLYGTKNLPKVLDVSMCDRVNFSSCDMENVEELRYKNREQEKKFTTSYGAKISIYNYCKNVVYTDDMEKEKVKVMPKNFSDVEM